MPGTEGIGARIAHTRRQRQWTQTDLAEAVSISIATMKRIEGGRYDPRVSTVWKLADELGVPVGWLITGDGDNEGDTE